MIGIKQYTVTDRLDRIRSIVVINTQLQSGGYEVQSTNQAVMTLSWVDETFSRIERPILRIIENACD